MHAVTRFKAAKAAATAAVVGSLIAANTAFAQQFDLSGAQGEVLGYVTTTIGFITAVGLAVLGLVMIAKAVKWARKAG